MKIIRTLILILLVVNSAIGSVNFNSVSLDSFVSSVASANNLNIYIDEDLSDEKISFYLPTVKDPKALFEAFKISIDKKGLNLINKGSFYYLSKKKQYRIRNYLIDLSYNCSDDFEKYLKLMKYEYSYFSSNNSFIVRCNYIQKQEIDKFLSSIDKQAKQVMLKFIVLSYDDSDIKERGVQFSSIYESVDGVIQSAINTLVFPLSSSHNIISSTSFYGALKLLDTNDIVKVNQYPYVLAKNNNNFKFESVQNIAYLVQNTVTDSTTVQNNNSYEYKDVGLKINGKASIYEDFITLEIDLTIEDIINASSDSKTPSTNKRYLSSITNLKIGQVLVLSGIKQNKQDRTDINVPILSGIPILGDMFKYSYESKSSSNITIAIQVLPSSSNADLLPNEERVSNK